MKIRRINRAVHRDLGYFLVGMCIIYGISGIALNHRHQWNPNYIIRQEAHPVQISSSDKYNKEKAEAILLQLDGNLQYKTHIQSGNNLRIFIHGGTVTVNMQTAEAQIETIRRRPVFYQVNYLHYNTPRKLWTWFSDIFAGGLIVLAITGLFILKGKNGITRRGAIITSAGIIIPLVLLFYYLSA